MNSNNHSTSQKKSRRTFVIIIAVVAALAILGLLLGQMDGRIVIVMSSESTPTDAAVSTTAAIVSATQTAIPTSVSTLTAAPAPSTLSPQAEQARAFAEPILQAIANRPPDFEDEFSTAGQGWQIDTFNGKCGEIVDGRMTLKIVPEKMTMQSNGAYTCGAHNSSVLNVTNFVFEVDLTQTQSEIQGVAGVQWRHIIDGGEYYRYYRVAVNIPGTRWTLAKSSTSQPGDAGFEILQESEGPASGLLRIIGRGNQFAVYINESPLFYLDDDLNPRGEIDLLLNAPDGPVTVEFDNVKLWNLDKISNLQPALARAFVEPILQAIVNRPPDYEYDFNEPENGWISSVEESNTRGYVDGEYFVTVKPSGGTGAGPGSNFVFSDFVAELDARILKATDPGGWGFIFREQPFPQSFRYHINFNSNGLSLFLSKDTYTDLFYLQGAPVKPAPETNHLLVIAKGANIAIYVNGEPVTIVSDSTLSSGIVSLGIHAGEQETEVRFDNFKIWNISDLP